MDLARSLIAVAAVNTRADALFLSSHESVKTDEL